MGQIQDEYVVNGLGLKLIRVRGQGQGYRVDYVIKIEIDMILLYF